MAIRYNRALSDAGYVAALKPGGPLNFLIHDLPLPSDEPFALDIHLREGNEIMYYHGTTRLLVLKLSMTDKKIQYEPSASPTYTGNPLSKAHFDRLGKFGKSRPEHLKTALHKYLSAVLSIANPRYYSNRKEGYWQNRLCVRFGLDCLPDDDWMIFDRECVLGFDNVPEKKKMLDPIMSRYEKIRNRLQSKNPKRWGQPSTAKSKILQKSFGDELDILALNKRGDLLAVELKYGSNASGIYWGPLQVCVYRDAFQCSPSKHFALI